MSELTTSILLIGTESAIVMLLVAGLLIFFVSRRNRQNKGRALELVDKVNKNSKEKLENLKIVLQETYGIEEEAAAEKAENLVKSEKKLYAKMVRMHMGNDKNAITSVDRDVKELVDNYRSLAEGEQDDNGDNEGEEKHATPLILRNENKELRFAKAQLEADLVAAMETMENMMTEYASMYDGSRGGGEQRVKNEMFQLREKLGTRVELDDLDTDIPDIGDPEEFK